MGNPRQFEIIHAGAPEVPVRPQEPAGPDHVDRDSEAGGEAQHRTGILRYVGLEQGKAHRGGYTGYCNGLPGRTGRGPNALQAAGDCIIPAREFRAIGEAGQLASVCRIVSPKFEDGGMFRTSQAETGFCFEGPSMTDSAHAVTAGDDPHGGTRRDFLYLSAGAFGVVGTAMAIWPFIHSMNPSADVLALSSTEIDLKPIAVGQAITVLWRGTPVFIRHRSQADIDGARAVPLDDLPDPQTDQARVKRPEWLVMRGVCTHLGCVPLGQKPTDPHGDYGGWFCPCHGSQYDTSGRIRKGPAPRNLEIPPYVFLDDTKIRIG